MGFGVDILGAGAGVVWVSDWEGGGVQQNVLKLYARQDRGTGLVALIPCDFVPRPDHPIKPDYQDFEYS